jgi:hypothetical protein
MLKKLIGPAIALAALCAAPAHAETVTVNPDGSWYQFDVDEEISGPVGLGWITLDGEEISFTFTTASSVALTVVDASATAGDRFEVFDNGVSLGVTSAVANHYFEEPVGTDFDAALESGNYSSAIFFLSAGTHTITGSLAASFVDEFGNPLNATIGGLRVAPVPLPAAAWLLLSGGGLMGLFSRRRNRVAA